MLLIPEAQVERDKRTRRDEPLLRLRQQLLEGGFSLPTVASQRVCAGKVHGRYGAPHSGGFFEFDHRVIVAPRLEQYRTQMEVSEREIRVQLQRFSKLDDGAVVITCEVQQASKFGVDDERQRIECLRASNRSQR